MHCTRVQRIARLHSQTPLCTARLMAEGCLSAGGNAERGIYEAMKRTFSLSNAKINRKRPRISHISTSALVDLLT